MATPQTILTYNQVLSVLSDIATRHYQINTFKVAPLYDRAVDKNVPNPVLYVRPINGTFYKSGDADNYPVKELRMELSVVDLVDKGLENRDDVKSDTFQILSDIITEINEHPYYQAANIGLVKDIQLNPLDAVTDDESYGWKCEINLRLKNNTAFCGLPFASIPNFAFTGTTGDETITVLSNYLTCATVTACTSFQNYITQVVSTATTSSSLSIANGLNTYTGGTTSLPKINISGLSINNISVSGASSFNAISATTFYSGSTNLNALFSPIGLITGVASVGTTGNLTTGSTAANPVLSIVGSPVFSSLNISGQSTSNSISATTISGGSIFVGSSNINSLFAPISVVNGVASVGTSSANLSSGGTLTNPIIQLTNTPTFTSLTATTISGGSIFVGSSNINSLFAPISVVNGVASVGTSSANLSSGGTITNPIIQLTNTPTFTSLSSTTISATTFYSASTSLGSIFAPANINVGVLSVGTTGNLTTGSTAANPTISIVGSPVFSSLNVSGQTTTNSISATTISGGSIFVGSSNINSLFAPISVVNGVASVGTSSANLSSGGTLANPIIQLTNTPTFTSVSGVSISATTFYSASTSLGSIFAPANINVGVLSVGTTGNLTTGSTAANPIISITNNPQFNQLTTSGATLINSTLTVTGASSFQVISATTFYSGSTNISAFLTGGGGVGGSGITRTISTITSITTAAASSLTDYVYLISGSTLTLPTAVGNKNLYTCKNIGTSTVTISGSTSQTIDGSLTVTLPLQYQSLDIISDNANWNII